MSRTQNHSNTRYSLCKIAFDAKVITVAEEDIRVITKTVGLLPIVEGENQLQLDHS
jgi:hypothetical protein